MEINQSVMDMWNLMGIFMVSNAIYFAACAFLIWVGFRFTNNIYNSPDTIIIAKILTTIFCLSVGIFTLGNMSAGTELFKDVADVFIRRVIGIRYGWCLVLIHGTDYCLLIKKNYVYSCMYLCLLYWVTLKYWLMNEL